MDPIYLIAYIYIIHFHYHICRYITHITLLGLAAQAHSHMTNIPNRATAKVSIGKDQSQPKSQITKETSSTGIRESAAALKEMVKTPIMREKNSENLKSRSDGSASNRYTSSTSCTTVGGPVLRHSVGTSSSSAYQDFRNVNRTISLDGSTVLEGAENA